MIPRIKSVKPIENYVLEVVFDDGKKVLYDVKEDITTLPSDSIYEYGKVLAKA